MEAAAGCVKHHHGSVVAPPSQRAAECLSPFGQERGTAVLLGEELLARLEFWGQRLGFELADGVLRLDVRDGHPPVVAFEAPSGDAEVVADFDEVESAQAKYPRLCLLVGVQQMAE